MNLTLVAQLLDLAVQLEPTVVGLTDAIIAKITGAAGGDVPTELQTLITEAQASASLAAQAAAGTDPQ